MPRRLDEVTAEILEVWPNVHFTAKPYLKALQGLRTIEDTYVYSDGKSLALYFLSNAGTWRGDDARRLKAELKELING